MTYQYDSKDRQTQEQRTLPGITGTFTTGYVYNYKGDMTQMTYPSGRVVNFNYATGGGCCNSRLASVVDQTTGTTVASSISYNAAGEITSRTLGSGVIETFAFNNLLQETGIAATLSGTTLMSFTYNYGTSTTNTGRVLSRTDSIQPEHSANYAYDSIYRLSQAVAPDSSWGISWTFDVWGNRLTQTPTGLATGRVGTQTFGYTNNRNTLNTYDAGGNQTNDGLHNYTFNAENQITQTDGGAASYAYDGEGRRMKKTYNGETTYYFYGQSGLISEFTTSNAIATATAASSTDKCFYHTTDKLGSAILVINSVGTVIENNRTLPYGEAWLVESTPSTNDKKFTTYLRDSESGLDYAMNRYMANNYGRFLTPDPKGIGAVNMKIPTSWNMYVYVDDDPLNITDPEGLDTEGPIACRDATLNGGSGFGIPEGQTVGAFLDQNSDASVFAQTIFTEARIATDDNAALEKAAIASVIMNRWQVVNGFVDLWTGAKGWGTADGSVKSIVWAGAGTKVAQFAVWESPGVLASTSQKNLNNALNSNYGSNACNSLVQAIGTAAGFWSDRSRIGLWIDRRSGLIFTSFGLSLANRAWYESVIGSYGNGPGASNIFFGVYNLPPIFRPVPGRRERIPNEQLPR